MNFRGKGWEMAQWHKRRCTSQPCPGVLGEGIILNTQSLLSGCTSPFLLPGCIPCQAQLERWVAAHLDLPASSPLFCSWWGGCQSASWCAPSTAASPTALGSFPAGHMEPAPSQLCTQNWARGCYRPKAWSPVLDSMVAQCVCVCGTV